MKRQITKIKPKERRKGQIHILSRLLSVTLSLCMVSGLFVLPRFTETAEAYTYWYTGKTIGGFTTNRHMGYYSNYNSWLYNSGSSSGSAMRVHNDKIGQTMQVGYSSNAYQDISLNQNDTYNKNAIDGTNNNWSYRVAQQGKFWYNKADYEKFENWTSSGVESFVRSFISYTTETKTPGYLGSFNNSLVSKKTKSGTLFQYSRQGYFLKNLAYDDDDSSYYATERYWDENWSSSGGYFYYPFSTDTQFYDTSNSSYYDVVLFPANATVTSGSDVVTFNTARSGRSSVKFNKAGTCTITWDVYRLVPYARSWNYSDTDEDLYSYFYTATKVGTDSYSIVVQNASTFTTTSTITVGLNSTASADPGGNHGTLSYSIADTSIATVNSSGTITPVKQGSTTVTITAPETETYTAGSCTRTVQVTKGSQYPRIEKLPTGLTWDDDDWEYSDGDDYSAMIATYGAGTLSPTWGTYPTDGGTRTYSSSNTSVATINSGGQITIKGAGEAWINATAAATTKYKEGQNHYHLTVNKATPALTVDSTASVNVGDTVSVAPSKNTNTDATAQVTYKSSDTSVATVNSSGVVTGKKAGTATITLSMAATTNFNAAANKTVTVTVKNNTPTITFNPTSISVKKNGTANIVATVNSGGTKTYKSNNTNIATVDANGKVTGVKVGSTTVTVSVAAAGSYTAGSKDIDVTVTKGDSSLDVSCANIPFGGTKTVSVTKKPTGFSGKLTYKTGDEKIAKVDANGVVTGVKTGTTTLTVSAAADDEYLECSKQINITVVAVDPTITASDQSVTYGETTKYISASITEGAKNEGANAYTYTSSDTTVATIGTDGKITTKKAGSTTVTIKSKATTNYNSVSKQIKLTVNKATPVITSTKTSYSVARDGTVSLGASFSSGDSGTTLTYASAATGTATVSAAGVVTGKAVGSTTVTITYPETTNYNKGTKSVTIEVTAKPATITASNVSVQKNATKAIGASVDSKGTLSYKSNNTAIATVDSSGNVKGVKVGTTTVTISSAAVSGTSGWTTASKDITVTVTKGSTTVTGQAVSVVYGKTAQISKPTLSPSDFNGTITYTSNNTNIATVNSTTGVVTGVNGGETTVTIKAATTTEYLEGSTNIKVTVTPADPTVSASNMSLVYKGDSKKVNPTIVSNGTVSYQSSNTKVATVASDGTVTPVTAGTATITVSTASTANYKAGSKTITVTVAKRDPVITASDKTIVYDGGISIGATSDSGTDGGKITYAVENTATDTGNVTVDANSGYVTGTKVGTATVKISVSESSNYKAGSKTVKVTVNRTDPGISVNEKTIIFDTTENLNASAISKVFNEGGKLIYSSDNTNVVSVDQSGNITGVHAGTANVTVRTEQTTSYNAGSKTVKITVNPATPYINADDVTVTFDETADVIAETNSDGAFSYVSNNTTIANVNETTGLVSTVNKGTTTITITTAKTNDYVSQSKTINVTVNPATPKIHTTDTTYSGRVDTTTEEFKKPDRSFNLGATLISEAINREVTEGTLVYRAEDPTIARVDQEGNVTMLKDATTKIYINAAAVGNYNAAPEVYVTVKPIVTVPEPAALAAQEGQDNRVTLTWTVPLNTGGRTIQNYKIERGVVNGTAEVQYSDLDVVSSANTRYVDYTAINGTTYSYRIYAINNVGTGEVSEAATAKPYRVPDASENISAVANSHHGVEVTWTAPLYDGGDRITEYRIYTYTDPDMRDVHRYTAAQVDVVYPKEGDTLDTVYTAQVEGLQTGTEYTFAVEAFNRANLEPRDDVADYAYDIVYTWDVTYEPTDFTGIPVGKGAVSFNWTKPLGGYGSPVLYYEIEYRKRGEKDWTVHSEKINDPETSYVLRDLDPGTWQYYRVRAYDTVGPGAYSEILEILPSTIPEGPVLDRLLSANGGVYITAHTENNNGNEITGYGVYYKLHGADDSTYKRLIELNTYSEYLDEVLAEGLTNGVSYDIAVTSINESGESEKSASLEVTPGKPLPVNNLKVVPKAGRVVSIYYDEADGRGNPILSYDLYIKCTSAGITGGVERVNVSETEYKVYGTDGSLTETLPNTSGDMTTYNYFSGDRLNGDTVTVYVVANNVVTSSDPCDEVTAGVGVPATPLLTNYVTDESSLALEWTKVDHNGNALRSYTARITDEKTKEETEYTIENGVNLDSATGLYSLVINDGDAVDKKNFVYPFEKQRQYKVEVYARNAAGVSQLSNAGEFIFAAPARPQDVEGEVENRSITIRWKMPLNDGGSPITGYKIYLNDETEPTAEVTWRKVEEGGIGSFSTFSAGDEYDIYVEDFRTNTHSPEYYTTQDNIEEFEITLEGLAIGYEYSARVTAENENGEGIEETTGEAEIPFEAADATDSIRTKAVSGTAIDVSWAVPLNDGGSAITGYVVRVYEVSRKNYETGKYEEISGSNVPVQELTTSDESIRVEGLTSGSAYRFTVATVTSAREGEESEPSATTRTHTVPSKPVITALESGVGSNGSLPLTVYWDEPDDNGDSQIIGYDIYVNGTMKMNLDGMISQSRRSYTINDVRLKSGNTYEVTVIAYNAVTGTDRANGTESDSMSVMLGTIPAPRDVKLAADKSGNLTVSWSASQYEDVKQYISSYYIYVNDEIVKLADKDTTEVTLTGLDLGTVLKIQVSVRNGVGEGNKSIAKTITIGTPSQVTNVRATAIRNGAEVTWTEVDTDVEEKFRPTAYVIYANGTEMGTFANDGSLTKQGTLMTATLEDCLEGAKEYDISVAAKNDYGTGLVSDDLVSVTPWSIPDPVEISNIEPGVGSFSFTYEYGSGNGAKIVDHKIYVQNSNRTDSAQVEGNKVTINNVPDGTEQKFYMLAVNEYGDTSAVPTESEMYAVTTGIPAAPSWIDVTAGDESALVEFSRSADVSKSRPVLGYYVYVYDKNGTQIDVKTVESIGDSVYELNIDGLTNGSTYSFAVQPYIEMSRGEISKRVSIVPGAPTAPKIKKITPKKGELNVSWYAPESVNAGRVSKYVVYVNGVETIETPMTSATIKNLVNGTDYSIVVSAYNYVGESEKSEAVVSTPGGTPDAVTNVKAESIYVDNELGIVLTWNEPEDNGGVPITDYIIEGEGSIEVIPENRTARIMGLERGQVYSYEITPVNKIGEGKLYTTEDIKCLDVPDAPTLIGGDSMNTKLYVIWTAPDNDGGTAVTRYTIYARPYMDGAETDGDPEGTVIWTCNPTPDENGELMESVAGKLVTGQQYEVTVAAVNIVGEGPESYSDRMQVNAEFVKTVPGAPINVAAKGMDSEVTISWNAPENDGNSTITKYQIWGGNAADDAHMGLLGTTSDGYTFTYTDTGLKNDVERFYKVKAVNGVSADGGEFSEIVSATPVKINAPTKPEWPELENTTGVSAYKVNAQGTEITLTWNESEGDELGGEITYEVYIDGYLQDTVSTGEYVFTEVVDKDGNKVKLTDNTITQRYNVQVRAVNELGGRSLSQYIRVVRNLNIVKGLESDGFEYDSQYAFGVFAAIDADYDGIEDFTPSYSVPSAPENVSLTTEELTAILSWDSPRFDGNNDISGYNIYINGDRTQVDALDALSSASGLKTLSDDDSEYEYDFDINYGEPYLVYVTAYNDHGEGDSSEPVYITPRLDEPTDLSADVQWDNTQFSEGVDIELSWTIPNTSATAYNLYINGAPQTIRANSSSLSVSGDRVTYTYPAQTGINYTFAVSSKYNSLESGLSNIESADTREQMPVPNKPVIAGAVGDTVATVTLEWTVPHSEGDAEIDHYIVYANGEVALDNVPADTLTADVELDGSALLKVAAVSMHNTIGTASAPEKYRSPKDMEEELAENAPPAPENLSYRFERNDGILADGDNTILTWVTIEPSEDQYAAEYYRVYVSYVEDGEEKTLIDGEIVEGTEFSFEAQPGVDYDVTVRSAAKAGEEEILGAAAYVVFTAPENTYKAPAKPVVDYELSEDGSTVTITWDQEEGVVYNLIVNGDEENKIRDISSPYEYELTDKNMNYTFVVEAENQYDDGGSAATDSDMIVINTNDSGIDESYLSDKPVITGTLSYDKQVKVFWKAPDKRADETGDITKYVIAEKQSDGTWTDIGTVNAGEKLVYTVDFDSIASPAKTVEVKAYKSISNAEIVSAISDPWIISPQMNVVTDPQDFEDENLEDAEVSNPDSNGDGEIDTGSGGEIDPSGGTGARKVQIGVATKITGIKADIVDQFGNKVRDGLDVNVEFGTGSIDLEIDDTITDDLEMTLVLRKPGYTTYKLTGITSENVEEVNITSLMMYAGDMDGNGKINARDLNTIKNKIGDVEAGSLGDFDNNAHITSRDIELVKANIGKEDVTETFTTEQTTEYP